MQIILQTDGKLKGCVQQIENINPKGVCLHIMLTLNNNKIKLI